MSHTCTLPHLEEESFFLQKEPASSAPPAPGSQRIPMHDLISFAIGILDARDPFTFTHSWRVAEISVLLGKKLALPPGRLAVLHNAAHLHDIGKIGVPDRVLLKEGPLSPEEYGEMKQHSEKGYHILRRFPLFRHLAPIVLHHHERMDGKGYPTGLEGNRIPLESRIIAVADSLDAITSDRPYRKGRPMEKAFEEIEAHRGTQFCSHVVDALLAIRKKIPLQLRETDKEIQSFMEEELPLAPSGTGGR